MNELISLKKETIGNDEVNAVDAKDLHDFLGVKTRFNDWITRQIKRYGFVINSDYSVLSTEVVTGGDKRKDYFISIDMAKELSMVERNEKGKQARQYFIECEKRYKASVPALPTYQDALRQLADSLDKNEKLQLENKRQSIKIKKDKPRVDFANRISSCKTNLDMGDFAKVISSKDFIIGRTTLFKILRREGVLMKSSRFPYQKFIDDGTFCVVELPYMTHEGEKRISRKTQVTPIGQERLSRKLTKWIKKNA